MKKSFDSVALVGSRSVGVDPRLFIGGSAITLAAAALVWFYFSGEGWGVNNDGRKGLAGALADACRQKAAIAGESSTTTDYTLSDEDGPKPRLCFSQNKDGTPCPNAAEPNSMFCGVHGGR